MFARLVDKRFDEFAASVNQRNYTQLRVFIMIGLVFAAADVAVEFILGGAARYFLFHVAALVYFIVLHVLYNLVLTQQTKHITLIFYLMEMPLMLIAVYMGTFLDPERPAITIMVFLCALPLFILDKPWRILQYIIAISVIFAVCCGIAKSRALFLTDMADLATYMLIAMAVNAFTLFERIDSVENVVRYRRKAEHDRLTGVYNRGGDERIKMLLENGVPGALLIIDVDDFKGINDAYGHGAGDEALVLLTKAVRREFRTTDVVMRLGGDEFLVYAAGMTDREMCRKKLSDLMQDICSIRVPCEGGIVPLSASIGCVMIGPDAQTEYAQAYKQADACLYRAKAAGKGRFELAE
ncbi:MAG: GGDEF domain-containing protein [Oscillospiraceae bacterium]|nr:GGDEF domain-containing protein [Oscillospiraceae bacterium]